ncbi:hypothetical protein AAG747_24825 [Rapidithrix thailandica]|uniref:Uncharacterized protein n=1 Tax=Rapidithrix thailandica TaxID=413964 RepID=A0AAW9S7K0_9BACT
MITTFHRIKKSITYQLIALAMLVLTAAIAFITDTTETMADKNVEILKAELPH